jgi:hypothetical protein
MPGKNAVLMDVSASTLERMERVAAMLGMTIDDLSEVACELALPGIERALKSARDTHSSSIGKEALGKIVGNVVYMWNKPMALAKEAGG